MQQLTASLRSPNLTRTVWALAIVTGVATASMLVAKYHGFRQLVWLSTVLASTAYLGIGLLGKPHLTKYHLFVFFALSCCWIGDVIGPENFVWGLYAFLGAHLFLMAGFWSTGLIWRDCAHALLPIVPMAAMLLAWILPHVPDDERGAVVAYTVVISAMLVGAWGARHANSWIVPAALIFYVSDIFVARWRYGGSAINGYLCYPLYYTSCVLFAMSMWNAQSAATQHGQPSEAQGTPI